MDKLIPQTFLWMFVGLLVTFITGYVVSINENMVINIFSGPLIWILPILEIVLVVFFSTRVYKMNPTSTKLTYLLYSFVSGLTFSSIFVIFEVSSIIYVFLIAAGVFALFGVIGYFTKLDLSKLGTILMMALFAVIICLIVNMFMNNGTLDLILSIVLLLIFFGFTAHDMQQLKRMNESGINNDVLAVSTAFNLYLDFINIFIQLLSLIGDAKD